MSEIWVAVGMSIILTLICGVFASGGLFLKKAWEHFNETPVTINMGNLTADHFEMSGKGTVNFRSCTLGPDALTAKQKK